MKNIMDHIIGKIVSHIIIIYFILIGIVFIMLSSSCSATYHYTKAVKKGLVLDTIPDIISIPFIDSIPVIHQDSIIWHKKINFKDTVIYVKEFKLPDTRQQIRQKEKTKRDSIKQENKTERIIIKNTSDIKQDSIRQTAKTERVKERIENKKFNRWYFLLIGIAIGIIITLIFNIRRLI